MSETRTDTNDSSIFRPFILCRNSGWTEEDDGEEKEESEGQPREEARGVRPCWTRHVGERGKREERGKVANDERVYIFYLFGVKIPKGHVAYFAT